VQLQEEEGNPAVSMQPSAQTSASGRGRSSGSGSVVVNVNGITSSNSNSRNNRNIKRGAVNGDTTLWMLLVAALGIGYAMGSISTSTSLSMSIGSIGRSAWKGITIFEEWVREIVVPIYTMGVLVYLAVRFYGNRRGKVLSSKASDSTILSAFHSSLSSFWLPPALRKLSTTTILEEEDESSDSLRTPSSPLPEQGEEEEAQQGDKPIDMTGTFKVAENNNFGEFLKAQGVPWFLCKAASKARPTHHFTHASSQKITIQIRGIIESETSYRIGGPFTETTIRGRVFQDTLSYLYDELGGATVTTTDGGGDENDGDGDQLSSSDQPNERVCVGVQTHKVAVGEGYKVQVERRIVRAGTTWVPTPEANPDGHCTYDLDTPCDFDRLFMSNKIIYDGENGEEPVIASQLFHRLDGPKD
jgi:hypothetical protein